MNQFIFQRKDLGQHFLMNQSLIKEEVKLAKISSKDNILEIGAGSGNLTKELIKTNAKIYSFEIDERYSSELKELKNENLTIIYDNTLNYSWRKYNKIVSNIPYEISEPLINKAIKEGINFLVLIIGENFKEILEKNNSKIGFISNLFYNISFIKKINKKEFMPIPRVDSWLIKLEKKEEITKLDKILQRIILYEGKIKNALIYSLVKEGYTKKQTKEILKKMKLNRNILEKSTKKFTIKLLNKIKDYIIEVLEE
ncbi:MAG: rRNA adenine N-6-methyltransferase family protein [Candidatus Pacearchaeota archaeon]